MYTYVIVVTTKDGRFFYSSTRGLVKEKWKADKFDSWEGADMACQLLPRTKTRSHWFCQRKIANTQPAEFPSFFFQE